MDLNSERQRRYTFDPAQLEPFEIGAAATVIMCWPGPLDEELRGEMQVRLAAALLRIAVGDEELALITPRSMKPIYAFRNVDADVKHMKRLEGRLSSALDVGNLAMPFLKKAYDGSDVRFPGMSDLTLASLTKAIELERRIGLDPANFRKRDWLPWLPVVHLAAAARVVLQQVRETSGREPEWLEMMADAGLIARWLREAQALVRIAILAFPMLEATLVRIELVGVTLPPAN
ncbi:hypothetical protein E6W36_15055 [Hankyongella ginsenosidimutans]|uniref:Uncharacterized protein n=1 Tax=Hankyongella ginsenosidimutans TaxID=1763828 RepID=A0A4D7C811_9SPHN|nr:hypothetical protein [Hankyongella ginsenosidimutans]QCI80350.1 hypothetical protein E6W36_15055 [Hankyongella ginsenosidimutans]